MGTVTNTRDRIDADVDKTIGTLKKKAGDALGDTELEREGQRQELRGKAKGTIAKGKEELRKLTKP